MKNRLPLVLSTIALVVATIGTPASEGALRVVRTALFAKNAGAVNGIKASRTARAGHLIPLNSAARLPRGVIPAVDAVSVDGIRASRAPVAGALLPLGTNGTLPESVLPLDSSTKAPNIAARIWSDVDQAIPNSAGGPSTPETYLHFDRTAFDTKHLFSATTPDRLTVPVAGIYLMAATVVWQHPPVAAGDRVVRLVAGGRIVAAEQVFTPFAPIQAVTGLDRLSAGDTVQVVVGTDADTKVLTADGVSPSLAVVWLAPG